MAVHLVFLLVSLPFGLLMADPDALVVPLQVEVLDGLEFSTPETTTEGLADDAFALDPLMCVHVK